MFYNGFNNFKLFVLNNFPFIEKDFDAMTDYQVLCKIFEYFLKYADEKVDNHEALESMVDPNKMLEAMNDIAMVQRNMFALSQIS